VQIIIDSSTGRPKGVAFVVFHSSETAKSVVEQGEHMLGRQKMRVQYYQFKTDKKFLQYDLKEEHVSV
jgi:hypothetical protein